MVNLLLVCSAGYASTQPGFLYPTQVARSEQQDVGPLSSRDRADRAGHFYEEPLVKFEVR